MSKKLAFSACISVLAMAGLALAAPRLSDQGTAQAKVEADAAIVFTAPA